MSTVAAIPTAVNLPENVTATVSDGYGLQIRHCGNLIAALELAEAITMAKMVLAYAEHYHLAPDEAAVAVALDGEDADIDRLAARLGYDDPDVRFDAAGAHFGHD